MYVAIINTPGYLPDSCDELPEFDTPADAWGHLQGELENIFLDEEDEIPGQAAPTSCRDNDGPYGQAWEEMNSCIHIGAIGAVTLVRPGNQLDTVFEVQKIS